VNSSMPIENYEHRQSSDDLTQLLIGELNTLAKGAKISDSRVKPTGLTNM